MIHAIYIYFIVAAVCFGVVLGDQFNKNNIVVNLLMSVVWFYHILKYLLVKLWDLDMVKMTVVHLGYNVLRNQENIGFVFDALDTHMLPRWRKKWYGVYLISGLSKLKRMNNHQLTKIN